MKAPLGHTFVRMAGTFLFLWFLQSCGPYHYQVYVPKENPAPVSYKASDTLRGQLTPLRTYFDVYYYDLSVEVFPDEKSIKGVVYIYFTAEEALRRLQIDLHPNMKINYVRQGNMPLSFSRSSHALFVEIPEMAAGEKSSIRISWEGQPVTSKRPPWEGGFVWAKNKDGEPHVGVACEDLGANLWWPNKDHPSDEADSMSIRITGPEDLVCVSNGKLRKRKPHGNKVTWQWFVSNPINNSNVTLNVAPYELLRDTFNNAQGQQELLFYVLPENKEKARSHFRQIPKLLSFFEMTFGPYPWWDDGYKIVESPFVGMEHQSAIAYGNGYSNEKNYFTFGAFDYILVHETAHEWWGNSLSACDQADSWLHEGFATYSEALYVEYLFDYKKSLEYLLTKRWDIRNQRPLVGPRGVNHGDPDDTDIYNKGAWVLHTFRNVLENDELFFELLRDFYNTFARQIICTEDLIHFFNEKTKLDWTPFFRQYLYDRRPPTLEWFLEGRRLYYRWHHVPKPFEMPVEFIINDHTLRLQGSTRVQTHDLSNLWIKDVSPNDLEFYFESKKNPQLKEIRNIF